MRRQMEELEKVSGVVSSALTVDGVPVNSYLTSLAVRDLSNLVKPEDIITSEHLVTLLAVVPKYSEKDWLSSNETLTTYVVPRSSKKLHEDSEYALYTVTLFRRDADNFRTEARERGFQIHDYEFNPKTQESRKQEIEKLMRDQDTLRSSLLQWCYASYGEVNCTIMPYLGDKLKSTTPLLPSGKWNAMEVETVAFLTSVMEAGSLECQYFGGASYMIVCWADKFN